MRRIDWYIIKKFLSTFFLAITLIILIVVIFDVSERIDDFIQEKAPLDAILFDYYLNFIPHFVNLFSPLFTFIAVVFFTSKLASNTELIAMLSSSISFRRILVPYLLAATLLSGMTFYLANFLIPPANERRLAFELEYIHGSGQTRERNIHLQTSENDFVYVQRFDRKNNTGFRFTHEQFEGRELVYKLSSEHIRWDTTNNHWVLENFSRRFFHENGQRLIHGDTMDTTMILKPDDFTHQVKRVEVLDYFELREFIREEEIKGSGNISIYKVEKHRRMAAPFATIVLTLIGFSLSSRRVRGGTGMHLAAGITISFAFILFMQISTTFAIKASLEPWIAVWLPNFVFTIIGLLLMRYAPK